MSNHLKAFAFSIELLQDMITTGWEVGTTSIVRCTQGVPRDAVFEWIEPSEDNIVVFVFSHPSFPIAHVDTVPREVITMQNIPLEAPR